MRVPSLGGDDFLEKGMAIHSSSLAWRIPDKPERRTLGQSLARTDKFISAVKLFYRRRNKELRVYSQQSAYRVNT